MPPKPRANRASTRARSTRTASGIQVTPIADPDSDVEMASVGVDEEFVDNTKDADDDDFDVEIPTASKGRKRKSSGTAQPKKPAKRSKKKGKLASLLTEMPSEVVLEICSSMHPSDLLNLSRSAKVFARFLLGSSVSGVWRAARLQIEGMPDCPEDMTEQKYAHFIFGNSCSNCGRIVRSLDRVLWNLRQKFCEPCQKLLIDGGIPTFRAVRRPGYGNTTPPITLCLTSTLIRGGRGSKAYLVARSAEFDEMQGKYSKLDPKSRQELETQRIKEKREQEEVGSRLKKFSESLGQQHGKELDAVREEKADNLKKRLIATGIREDIVKAVPQNDWRKYPTMLVSKPLTDTAWGKIRVAAEKKLQDTIQRIKILATEGVGRALAAQYRTEFQPLDHSVFRPRFELLLHSTVLINAVSPYLEEHYFEIFQKMLVTSRDGFSWEYFTSFKEFDQHQNQRVTAVTQYLASLGLTLQGLPIAEAISDMEQHIQSPFLREMPNPNPEPSALNLATSLFHRRIAIREDRGLPWLNCLRTSALSAKIKFPSPLDPTAPLPQLLACDIKFDSIASSITARIISACGLDPNTCTHEQLETLNPMVACVKCSDGPEASKYRLTMPWDEAYPHWADEHSSMPPEASEWAILDDEQSATFIKHLEKQPVKRDEYYCTLCELKPEESTLSIFSSYLGTTTPNDGLSLTRLKTHLRTTHKLPPATAEQSQYHQKLRPFGRLHPIMWNASTKSSKVRTTPSWWDDKQPWKDPSISYGHPLSFLFDDMYSDDDDDMYPGGLPFYDDYDGFYSDEGPMFGYDPDDFW